MMMASCPSAEVSEVVIYLHSISFKYKIPTVNPLVLCHSNHFLTIDIALGLLDLSFLGILAV